MSSSESKHVVSSWGYGEIHRVEFQRSRLKSRSSLERTQVVNRLLTMVQG